MPSLPPPKKNMFATSKMNNPHAMAHMKRAQELLSYGQMQFGGPMETPVSDATAFS